jgi:hypothetical protein
MKRITLLLAVAASLAVTAAALADGTPPPSISGPAPVAQISASMQSPSGITIPSVDSLKLPKYQVMNEGGCAIALSWHPASGLRALNATPYGSCNSQNLSKTMAWTFSSLNKSHFAYDLHGIGNGFHVFTLAQKVQAAVAYSTVRGRHLLCSFTITTTRGTHICK